MRKEEIDDGVWTRQRDRALMLQIAKEMRSIRKEAAAAAKGGSVVMS